MNDQMKYKIQTIQIDEEKEIDLKSDHNMIITKIKTKGHMTKGNIVKTASKWKRKKWTELDIKKKQIKQGLQQGIQKRRK